MNCPKCNTTVMPSEANFCPNCGIAFNGYFENETYRFKVHGVLFSMVLVRHGQYEILGSDEHFNGHTIPYDFYILDSPITREQWDAVMYDPIEAPMLEEGNKPKTSVTLDDCLDFIGALNKKSNKIFDLPSKEEWIYADSGGHHGYDGKTEDIDTNSKPHDVKQGKPNCLGIYDMHNNIVEWTRTYFYRQNDKGEDVQIFSCHGGVFSRPYLLESSRKYSNMGFRIVLRAPKINIPTTDMTFDDIFTQFRDVFESWGMDKDSFAR